jgi:hypothetical protein
MAGTFSGYTNLTYTLTTNPTTITSAGTIDVNSTSTYARGIFGASGVAWTLTNLGTVESIGSLGIGINLQAGGFVTNGTNGSTAGYVEGTSAGIEMGGNIGTTKTVINYGRIKAVSTGSNAEGVFFYNGSGTDTVINSGSITAGAFGGNATAVKLSGGDTVTNSGLINAAYGSNEIGVAAFYSTGGVTVTNSGTIQAVGTTSGIGIRLAVGSINNSGLISGSSTGVTWQPFAGPAFAGTVTNSGTILATTGNAISLNGGGSVGNSGLIEGFTGVGIFGFAGTVTNSGTIRGTGTAGVGIDLTAGGTVVDSGTVSGASGTAIYFGGTGGNRLVLDPGYALSGGASSFRARRIRWSSAAPLPAHCRGSAPASSISAASRSMPARNGRSAAPTRSAPASPSATPARSSPPAASPTAA